MGLMRPECEADSTLPTADVGMFRATTLSGVQASTNRTFEREEIKQIHLLQDMEQRNDFVNER
jgi:hypothetical protein